jgi:hypothetical protein
MVLLSEGFFGCSSSEKLNQKGHSILVVSAEPEETVDEDVPCTIEYEDEGLFVAEVECEGM